MSNEGKIEAGYYTGRAIAGSEQYATNPSNGNEQIAIDVEVPSLGRALTVFLHFTEAAAPYGVEKLRACGWKGDDITNLAGIDANEIQVSVKYETYQGKEKMKVDISTGGGRIKLENQMDEKGKRAFAARMKGLVRGTQGAAQQPLPPRPGVRPQGNSGADRRQTGGGDGGVDDGFGGGNDEIPF